MQAFYGTFLDPNGSVSFVNTRFIGHIFGGDSVNMQIVSGDTITQPTVPDAGATVALLGIALPGIEGVRRILRAK